MQYLYDGFVKSCKQECNEIVAAVLRVVIKAHPGKPPLSIWFARVTSSLQTSNCHFRKPSTPHNTLPVWMPILMSTLNPVASRTNLQSVNNCCSTMHHFHNFIRHFSLSSCIFFSFSTVHFLLTFFDIYIMSAEYQQNVRKRYVNENRKMH